MITQSAPRISAAAPRAGGNGHSQPAPTKIDGRRRQRNTYSDDLLRLAAHLYYIEELDQMAVAKFVKVSQAKVSRLLSLARERGIVRITITEYEPRDKKLEAALRDKFGLSNVAVIKTLPDATAEEARMTVARFGAPFVASLIKPNSTVAISGGRTLRELVELLPENKDLRLNVIQAMGSIDANVGPLDAFELGRTLARLWGGVLSSLNSPAFVPDKKTRDAFVSLQQIRGVCERLSQVDVALVGIGTLDNSVFIEHGVLQPADQELLSSHGAVGEICGRFYDERGRECDTPWRDRIISAELEQIRKTPQVVGIIAGGDRSAAIKAAIRGGLIKALVIDDVCARAMLPGFGVPTKANLKTARSK